MKTKCPHCNAKFKAPDEYKGRESKCPKCKQTFIIAEFMDVPESRSSKSPVDLQRPTAQEVPAAEIASSSIVRPTQAKHPIGHEQEVRVKLTKSTSGFGIAALVLGIIACLTCWIPFLGLLVIPLGIIGVVLGAIGVLASAIGRRSYIGLPASGTIVSLVAIIISVMVTGVATRAVTGALDYTRAEIKKTNGSTTKTIDKPSYKPPFPPKEENLSKPSRTRVDGSGVEKGGIESQKIKEKQAYIQNVELYDAEAKYYKTYLDEKTPGVKFKIRNKGDRTLTKVKVTVYFRDARGVVIAEEDFYPVLSSSFSSESNKPLKPNYIWQIEKDKFYKAESVPEEWEEGNVIAKITDIEFQE